jgi:hypothetical protein
MSTARTKLMLTFSLMADDRSITPVSLGYHAQEQFPENRNETYYIQAAIRHLSKYAKNDAMPERIEISEGAETITPHQVSGVFVDGNLVTGQQISDYIARIYNFQKGELDLGGKEGFGILKNYAGKRKKRAGHQVLPGEYTGELDAFIKHFGHMVPDRVKNSLSRQLAPANAVS